MVSRQRLGLCLGRFQPLHAGHLAMIDQAFRENDCVVICIGSAQRSEPRPIEARLAIMEETLAERYPQRNWRVVPLVDPEPMEIWPQYVKEVCEIDDSTANTFYRADPLEAGEVKELSALGFAIKIIPRVSFIYRAPDGQDYSLASASEIKALHEQLGAKID